MTRSHDAQDGGDAEMITDDQVSDVGRIADALRGRYRVKVPMSVDFAEECRNEAERQGWSLETWIVAAMVHMLERDDG